MQGKANMHDFCTLFDKNYLFQGVALYRSLLKTTKEFRLYVLCMDQTAYDMITKLNQQNLIPIHISEIVQDEETRAARDRTSHGQFCWVCQPLVCSYVLDHFKADMVTYLEADSMFFSDPTVLFTELEGYSVSLVPHRYTPRFDKSATSGRYCVQFNAFRNDPCAREVLRYWKECCYQYTKDRPDYYPGQMSLDEWPTRFSCVREIENRGAGVAPWNVQQYEMKKSNNEVYINNSPLVFYHFHQYCRYEDGSHELGAYPLTAGVINAVYAPYVREMHSVEEWVQSIDPAFIYKRVFKRPKNLIRIIGSYIMRNIKGTYNVYEDRFFKR
jgi:hypothetical protein